jgi:hypothetical protein
MTLALKAVDKLKDELVKVPDYGFGLKDYLMVCHGCGKLHAVLSAFISTPLAIAFKFTDGSLLSVPAYGCKDCMSAPGEVIRKAYYEGMTKTAYNAAATRLDAELTTKGRD